MKLIRFGEFRKERPGVVDSQGRRRDCSAHFADWNSEFFAEGGLQRLVTLLDEGMERLPIVPDEVRLGACVARPGKVVCIGLNYRDHAAESNLPMPTEPLVFLKASNTVVGPYDAIQIPRQSSKTDWEVELGVVIGKEARYLPSVQEAAECIAGYCISHDVSERHFQLERGGQWTKGKSCDTFNPLGPWLATADELADVGALKMSLHVNDVLKQNGSTAMMEFRPDFLVHYLSQFMTLETGDVITTGTPPGVGFARSPQEFLKEGDVVRLSIDGLGHQRQQCISA